MNEIIYDLHCDLPTKVYLKNADIVHNNCHFALDKCKDFELNQFFACYLDQKKVKNHFVYIDNMIKTFKEKADGKIPTYYLTIEGGEALEGKIENLLYFHNQGVKLLTLTWNYENELGYGVLSDNDAKPLKPFGIEVVKKMNELNMIVDVSHLNEGGFWSAAENSTTPIIASHSNSQKICPDKRNLTDEQIMHIVKTGGLIGINLHPPFLNPSGKATISDILKHIDYMLSLGAENNIALGCDFDGIDVTPEGLNDVSQYKNLFTEMRKNNFPEEIIAKIKGENCKNFLKIYNF